MENCDCAGVVPVASRIKVVCAEPLPGKDAGTLTWTLTSEGAPKTVAVMPVNGTEVRLLSSKVLV